MKVKRVTKDVSICYVCQKLVELGICPYRLAWRPLFFVQQWIKGIMPIIVKDRNCHQPVLSISWSLLAPAAKAGMVRITCNKINIKIALTAKLMSRHFVLSKGSLQFLQRP